MESSTKEEVVSTTVVEQEVETVEIDEEYQDQSIEIKLVIPSGEKISLVVLPSELIADLLQQLFDYPSTSYMTHYGLSYNGVEVSEMVALSEIEGLESGSELVMVPLVYDQRSARQHVRRLRTILAGPIPYDVPHAISLVSHISEQSVIATSASNVAADGTENKKAPNKD